MSSRESGLDATGKHTIHIPDVLRQIDHHRLIYPNGVLGELKEFDGEARSVKRIELFAEEQSKELYGIIRNFFVAYSSEKKLLELAGASNNVVAVRALQHSARSRSEGKKTSETDVVAKNEIVEDRVILKMPAEAPEELRVEVSFRVTLPYLIVPPRWLDRMQLDPGDRIMISNPIEEYLVPPPNLAD